MADPTPVALDDAIPLTAADGSTGRNNARDIRYGLIGQLALPAAGTLTWRNGVLARGWDGSNYTDLRVVQSSGRTVSVNAGAFVATRSGQGPYLGWAESSKNITLVAADGTNPRIDIVCLIPYDQAPSAFPGDPQHGPYLIGVTGTPAGSPSVPSTPAGAIKIAEVARAAGAPGDTIVQANITDKRQSAGWLGMLRPLLAGDSASDAGGYPGDHRYRAATATMSELIDTWDGALWRTVSTIKGTTLAAVQSAVPNPRPGDIATVTGDRCIYEYDGTTWNKQFTKVRTFTGNATPNPLQLATTTATDLTGATVTFTTLGTNAVVSARALIDVESSGASDAFRCQVLVDGAANSKLLTFRANGRATCTQEWPITIATAGSHTIKLQIFKIGSADTVGAYGLNASSLECTVYDG